MFATTNWGVETIACPAGGLKSGQAVYLSDDLAGVSQSDYKEGEPAVVLLTGVERTLEVGADIPAYKKVRVSAAGVVSAGAAAAGYAKLGVTKYASKTRTRKHLVTQAEHDAAGGPFEGDAVGSYQDENYKVVKIIVQGI